MTAAADKRAEQLRKRYEANRAAAQKALTTATRTPTVLGSTGQPVPNPLFATARNHDALALRFHQELVELARAAEVDAALERAKRLTTF